MKKLRIGVIGCGGIANNKHFPALMSQKDKCEIVGFCDTVEERARTACEKFGSADAKYYTDYKELLQDESIDVVHVCTPNVSHCPITVAAFEAGKHVLCEKPMAHCSADAQKMVDAGKFISYRILHRCGRTGAGGDQHDHAGRKNLGWGKRPDDGFGRGQDECRYPKCHQL